MPESILAISGPREEISRLGRVVDLEFFILLNIMERWDEVYIFMLVKSLIIKFLIWEAEE